MSINYMRMLCVYAILVVRYLVQSNVKTFEEVIEQGVNGNDVKGKQI